MESEEQFPVTTNTTYKALDKKHMVEEIIQKREETCSTKKL